MNDEVEQFPVEEGGWATASVGAVANTTAVIRWGAWALLVSGPLLGLFALASQPTVAAAPHQVEQHSHRFGDGQAGPAGFAALYVTAYVAAGQGTESSLSPFFPDTRDLSLSAKPGSQKAQQVDAVRVQEVSAGYWSVTVAARIPAAADAKKPGSETDSGGQAAGGDGVLRYFQVPVRAAASGALVAAALPAEVSAPDAGAPPELDYGLAAPAQSSDAAVQTLQAFLSSYLTGGSDLDRFLSPRTVLSPVSPAPYTRVQITQLAERSTDEPGSSWPDGKALPDGARRQLLVTADATGPDGQARPLTYAISLKARAGRWEISSLDAAPGLKTAAATAGQEGGTP
ncbi:conjugal transfer protein [Streptomyces sp. NPDC090052]|uniref:conjugal transfer protein n=1 Tax=Streptomyces sp. NPDC090052 TaxID=3365931 RepID=UPI003805477C